MRVLWSIARDPTQPVGEFSHGWRLEQRSELQEDATLITQSREHLCGAQRISAQTKEMVQRTDPRQPEVLREDRRNERFLAIARRDVVDKQRSRELVHQCAPAYLAHRIFRNL